MLFYAIALILALPCMLVLVWPLVGQVRSSESTERDEKDVRMAENVAIYRQGLAEVARDYSQGLIEPSDYDRLAAELKRNLLEAHQNMGAVSLTRPAHKQLAVSLVVVALISSIFLYRAIAPIPQLSQWHDLLHKIGPGVGEVLQGGQQLNDLASEATVQEFVLVAQYLLHTDPALGSGWALMSDIMQQMQAQPQALVAARKAYTRHPEKPEHVLRYVQLELASHEGRMTPRAESILNAALEIHPGNPSLIMLQAMGYTAAKQWDQADTAWSSLREKLLLNPQDAQNPMHQQALISIERALVFVNEQRSAQMQPETVPQKEGGPKAGEVHENQSVNHEVSGDALPVDEPAVRVLIHGRTPENLSQSTNARLFVVAKPQSNAGPPLAVKRLRPQAWPVETQLTIKDAMLKERSLAGQTQVVISAWWSFDGSVSSGPAPGAPVHKVNSEVVNPEQNPLVTLQLTSANSPDTQP